MPTFGSNLYLSPLCPFPFLSVPLYVIFLYKLPHFSDVGAYTMAMPPSSIRYTRWLSWLASCNLALLLAFASLNIFQLLVGYQSVDRQREWRVFLSSLPFSPIPAPMRRPRLPFADSSNFGAAHNFVRRRSLSHSFGDDAICKFSTQGKRAQVLPRFACDQESPTSPTPALPGGGSD